MPTSETRVPPEHQQAKPRLSLSLQSKVYPNTYFENRAILVNDVSNYLIQNNDNFRKEINIEILDSQGNVVEIQTPLLLDISCDISIRHLIGYEITYFIPPLRQSEVILSLKYSNPSYHEYIYPMLFSSTLTKIYLQCASLKINLHHRELKASQFCDRAFGGI